MSLSPDERGCPHLFTVDVEEYFQVNAFDGVVRRAEWDTLPSRVERSVELLLTLLASHDARGTFFVLGWIADRHPKVVRRIAEAGHEVASHGWWHRRVTELSPDEFRAEARDSRAVLEDVCGARVLGFRAPSFSIVPGKEWALDILLEEGYRYDSSLFPIRRRGYGYPGASPVPHRITRGGGELLELPPATTSVAGVRLPAAGGGYFRQLPYALTRRAFAEHGARGTSAVFYIHPWEVDPGQPRLRVPRLTRFRHYRGLERTAERLGRLFSEFSFTSVRDRFSGESDEGNAFSLERPPM